MIRFMTAGESHGKGLLAIIDGVPAGLKIAESDINRDLARRQKGYGRGTRMSLETDKVEIVSGVRWGETIGSPVGLMIHNKDYENNKELMSLLESDKDIRKFITKPRPGHADLTGLLKFGRQDIRDILERASARETAIRVAAGAVCRKLLAVLGIQVYSFVEKIGGVAISNAGEVDVEKSYNKIEQSQLRCPDSSAEKKMMAVIDKAKQNGDSVGGLFRVIIKNAPAGLGSYTQWDLRINARLANSICSIPAVKGVLFGDGMGYTDKYGSEAMDEIFYKAGTGYYRKTNHSGGIEGGMTNGEDVIVRGIMKPIPSLSKPLKSVDIKTKKQVNAEIVRADTCAVPACAVVAEAMSALTIANAITEKFGSDTVQNLLKNIK